MLGIQYNVIIKTVEKEMAFCYNTSDNSIFSGQEDVSRFSNNS